MSDFLAQEDIYVGMNTCLEVVNVVHAMLLQALRD